jgi:hypothetical protein
LERGIYAASAFKAKAALKRAKARAPSAARDIAQARFKLTTSPPCDNLVAWQNLHWDAAWAHY